jgi:hypothetical protein
LRKTLTFVVFTFLLSFWAAAQKQDIYEKYDIYRNPFRVFINKFSFTLTSGYGVTNYEHKLAGYMFFQDENQQMILGKNFAFSPIFNGYSNWASNPISDSERIRNNIFEVPFPHLPNPVNNPALVNNQYLVDADSIGLSFGSYAGTIPLLFSIHYNIKDFRVGAGFQYEKHLLNPLKPSVNGDIIRDYEFGYRSTRYLKWFGMVGYQFYEYWDYTFVGELQVGAAYLGPQFNTNTIGIGQKLFVNLGVNIEKNLSEYFRVVVRPSYDFKRFTISNLDGTNTKHNNGAWMVQAGVSINIPEIPRSPQKSDHVQLKHVLMDPATGQLIEVRGQPFWKKQNPKVGENHRKLWRYKWRNKRKLDPY